MELTEAIALLESAGPLGLKPALWADLGSGTGLFTFALAHLLAKKSHIYAVDKTVLPLEKLANPNEVLIESRQLDFVSQTLPFSGLDGILMANSLHYVRDQTTCIRNLSNHLNTGGCFLLVEYDTNRSNPWVPYPIQFDALPYLFNPLGYSSVQKLGEMPSRYGRANLYSALIRR